MVVAAEPAELNEAIRAAAAHVFQYRDAMLWATVRRAGCRLLLTEDIQDDRELEGVMFASPFNPDNRKLVDLALPRLES